MSPYTRLYVVNDSGLDGQFKKAHEYDAGYDLLANESLLIESGTKGVIATGLKVLIPKGYVGIIKSRSGLSVKHDLEHGAGVIDSGYTGEIKVVLRNFGQDAYYVERGDKIAQMLIVPVMHFKVASVPQLPETKRGENGFNSTGY